jgi:type VI secretion system secreted protein Hcp
MAFMPGDDAGCDMFLKIDGARSGLIKGESRDPAHSDEIQVLAWAWSMEGNASATVASGGGGKGAAQVSVRELVVTKRVDLASTALMSALRGNDLIKNATLSVRKAGGASPVDYVKIMLEGVRVRSMEIESGGPGTASQLLERVSFAFKRITVEYRPQLGQGAGGGVSSFSTEIGQS